MREILFRGKSVNNGEWAEGFLVIDTIFCEDAAPVKHYHIDEMNLGTFPVEFQSGISETVDPETVGQFTGMTDKNDKKIFEGDIVKDESGVAYPVVYGLTGFFLKYASPHSHGFHYDLLPLSNYWHAHGAIIEVIGNIHDNPELVEVK